MVLRLLGGSVDVAGPSGRRTIAADDLFVGPLESSLHHDEIAVVGVLPGAAPRRRGRVRGDRPPPRRLRAVRRRRAGRLSDARRAAGYLSVCDVPTVVDLTGVADADLGDAGPRAPRPGRRHPRHRRLPRPAGPGADRAGRCRGEDDGPDEGSAVSEELHDVRLHGQRRRARRRRTRPAAALRRAAPRRRPDRHPRRLRARRLRRVHGAGRRPADAVVPDVRGLRGRLRDHHRRGADQRRRLARARCSRRSWSATGCSAASARRAS